jgi:hypothetical protein
MCDISNLFRLIFYVISGCISLSPELIPIIDCRVFAGKNLKKFEFWIDSTQDFPLHDGGKVIFKRDWLIKKTASLVLEKKYGKFGSYYWRAPVGSGKTVFLKLMGRELESRGCDVYMTSGNEMDIYDDEYFPYLAKESGDKTVVLLIDEVQNNLTSKHWLRLLKGNKPPNLLVLGVGIPRLVYASPQFDNKYPKGSEHFPMFFTSDDLPELRAYFNKTLPHSEDITAEVCEKMLTFTAGHPFPFVKFVAHLLDPHNEIDVANIDIDNYTSREEFRTSEVCHQVRDRCFAFLMGNTLTQATNLLLNKGSSGDKGDLEKLGVWSQDYFISPLVASEVFLKVEVKSIPGDEMITLDDTQKTPYAQQVICAGLRDMTEEHFKDAHYNKIAVENAVGFQWGFNVKSVFTNIWISPQPRTMYKEHTGRGRKPNIDFFLNGRLNMGIELALDVNKTSLTEHVGRFELKYKRYNKTGAVLHFDTKNEDLSTHTSEGKIPVYTFVKKRNELFCGSRSVKTSVSKYLKTPPARSYSTFAVGCLRKVLKGLK